MPPNGKGRVACVCRYCGVTFYLWPSAIADGRGHFCCYAHVRLGLTRKSGPEHAQWKGGRHLNTRTGYVYLVVGPKQRRSEHRVVWEAAHGPIPPGVDIHHKNGVRSDNRLENLEARPNGVHQREHHLARMRAGFWAIWHDRCVECGTTARPHRAHGYCAPCYHHRHMAVTAYLRGHSPTLR